MPDIKYCFISSCQLFEFKNELIYETKGRKGEGDFVLLDNNVLAYIYTNFDSIGDHSEGSIAIIKSNDRSRKIWADEQLLIKNHGKQNIMSVSLLNVNDKIIIQYLEKNSLEDLRVVRRHSNDDLKTISAIKYLLTNSGYNVVNNSRIIKVKDKIFTPISRHGLNSNGTFIYGGNIDLSVTIENEGGIYSIFKQDSLNFQEPGIVHYNDSLFLWMRNKTSNLYFSKSHEDTINFSSYYKSNILIVPYSPSTIKNIDDQLIIAYSKADTSNFHKPYPRNNLYIGALDNGLQTIKKEWQIEKDTTSTFNYAYSAIYSERNKIYLAYYVYDKKGTFFLRIRKITNLLRNI